MPTATDARVLDAWALIAWQRAEPSAPRVRELLRRAAGGEVEVHISAINAGEVFYQLTRQLGARRANEFWADLTNGVIPIRVAAASLPRVERAARVKARGGVSYADAFAVALAQEMGVPLLTGDPEIRALGAAGLVALDWLP